MAFDSTDDLKPDLIESSATGRVQFSWSSNLSEVTMSINDASPVVMGGTPQLPEPGGTSLRFSFDRDDTVKALASETVEKSVSKVTSILKAAIALAIIGMGALGLNGYFQQRDLAKSISEQKARNAELQARSESLAIRARGLESRVADADSASSQARQIVKDIQQVSRDQSVAFSNLLTAQTAAFAGAVVAYGGASEKAERSADSASAAAVAAQIAARESQRIASQARIIADSARDIQAQYQETSNLVEARLKHTWEAVIPEDSTQSHRIPGSEFSATVYAVHRSDGVRIRLYHTDEHGWAEPACDGTIMHIKPQAAVAAPCRWNNQIYRLEVQYVIKQHESILHRGRFPDLVGVKLSL